MSETVGVDSEADLKLAGLSLWVLKRQFPGADDYWDGNCLNIRACVEAPGAHVEIGGPWLRADELSRFAEQLAALDRDVAGTGRAGVPGTCAARENRLRHSWAHGDYS